MSKNKNRPHEYIVYTNHPGYKCRVKTLRIPYGKTYHDMVNYLPPTVGKLRVLKAYSAADARWAAAKYGVKCGGRGLSGCSCK